MLECGCGSVGECGCRAFGCGSVGVGCVDIEVSSGQTYRLQYTNWICREELERPPVLARLSFQADTTSPIYTI